MLLGLSTKTPICICEPTKLSRKQGTQKPAPAEPDVVHGPTASSPATLTLKCQHLSLLQFRVLTRRKSTKTKILEISGQNKNV